MARTGFRGLQRPDEIGKPAARPAPRRLRPHRPGWLPLLLATLGVAVRGATAAAEPDLPFAPPSLYAPPGPATFAAPVESLPRPADLALVFYDPTEVLPRGFARLAAEIQAVFRSLGVEASWRVGGPFGEADVPEVPVIVLPRDPLPSRRGVMGLVVRDQVPQRAVWIFKEAVQSVLGHGSPGRDPHSLERALARVAAHEIVHAIAPDAKHAESGLMRHALGREFLLGAKAPIDARCASSFIARLSVEWQRRLGQARAEVSAAQ